MTTDKERFRMIQRELDAARRKHPNFACEMTNRSLLNAEEWLGRYMTINSQSSVAENLINEEWMEALCEYLAGDRKNCLVELAHTAVTVIRAMDFVEKEMEKGGGK